MCEGAILPKLVVFAIPLILSSMLQLLFNAVDVIVVGRFAGSQSLAAVGATTSLINLMVNLFIGLSIGANVLVGRYLGAKDEVGVRESVHTSILLALISGIVMMTIGLTAAEPILRLMATPSDVIELSAVYIRIYFIGMPAFMVYNFGASILRAMGDTRHPLFFLCISGAVNLVLNLVFVICFHLNVAGVALATGVSQYLSAFFVLRCLRQTEGMCHLEWNQLRLYRSRLIQILQIGGAAGFQSVMFNISNVIIQSSINSFGSVIVAGNTAACNIEGFIYVAMNAVTQTALSFVSQNYGARQYQRIDQIFLRCLAMVTGIGVSFGVGAYLMGDILLGAFSADPTVIKYGVYRLSVVCVLYALCGVMDVIAGTIRGLGYSMLPMVVSLMGACVFRIVWIFTVFSAHHTLYFLFVSYPISWGLTAAVLFICYFVIRKKLYAGKGQE